jgi:hypothetical protein
MMKSSLELKVRLESTRLEVIPVSQAQEHCLQNMVFGFADFSGTD